MKIFGWTQKRDRFRLTKNLQDLKDKIVFLEIFINLCLQLSPKRDGCSRFCDTVPMRYKRSGQNGNSRGVTWKTW